MDTEIYVLVTALVSLAVSYFCAEIFYNFYYNLKKDDNPIFKVIAYNSKFIDDKDKWIKHHRLYSILIFTLIVCIGVATLLCC